MMVEYAWRQPDGEIAPILSTEGYELMVKVPDGEWLRVNDLTKLALRTARLVGGTSIKACTIAAGDLLTTRCACGHLARMHEAGPPITCSVCQPGGVPQA